MDQIFPLPTDSKKSHNLNSFLDPTSDHACPPSWPTPAYLFGLSSLIQVFRYKEISMHHSLFFFLSRAETT